MNAAIRRYSLDSLTGKGVINIWLILILKVDSFSFVSAILCIKANLDCTLADPLKCFLTVLP